MTKLIWDAIGARSFQTGIDRGVLYISDNSGVIWNGLTSVLENVDDNTNPYYVDGIKYLDSENIGDFSAVLKAFTYPDEFEQFEGIGDIGNGLFTDDQPPKAFGLTYRTLVGNDIDGKDHGYQIHVIYNAIVVPDTKSHFSLNNQISPLEFSWTIFTTPVSYSGIRPTSHVIIDSTEIDPHLLEIIEGMLYGTNDSDSYLPSLVELITFVVEENLITIIDNGDGTWTAIGPDDLITMTDSTTFHISEANAIYLDSDTYEITDTEF